MNFNSPEYFFFFPAVLLIYGLVFRREHLRDLFLLAASYFFYMSWDWQYAGLIAFSTLVDYGLALKIAAEERPRLRKALLTTSLVLNLGLLGLFKYFNFFVDTSARVFELFGHDLSFFRHELLLPVGISFYTFQTLSYTIDVYRKEIPAERSLIKFALFVTFFPQLVAGPIVRAADFLPQLHRTPVVTSERFNNGLRLIFQGLFKKIVIADLLGSMGVDSVFADPTSFSSWDLLFALYGYSFQIYGDFSGYSDIAIGSARCMGYELTDNFNRPYLSQNMREFWTRWHISLSSWLRDYLYISLGGNRASPGRVKFNLMLTMLLGGLWHGAALNFVCWGAWHGLLLIGSRNLTKHDAEASGWVKLRRRFVTFHLIVISWLLFRVTSAQNFFDYVGGLAKLSFGTRLSPVFYAALATGLLLHFFPRERVEDLGRRFANLPGFVQGAVYAGLLIVFSGLSVGGPSFIYFQF